MSGALQGLCPACTWVQRVESQKGSVFWRCRKGKEDPRFPKYPPQPVWACAGYRPRAASDGDGRPPGDFPGAAGEGDPSA